MTWFNILFISVFGIFMLKNIISWVAGDMDLDLDLDGDVDIDVSGMLSFKGLLHFLLGFSTVLTTVGYEQTHSFVTPCSFSVATYILAVIVGIIVMVGLFYLYKFVMKLNHYSIDNGFIYSLLFVDKKTGESEEYRDYFWIDYNHGLERLFISRIFVKLNSFIIRCINSCG